MKTGGPDGALSTFRSHSSLLTMHSTHARPHLSASACPSSSVPLSSTSSSSLHMNGRYSPSGGRLCR